VKDLVAGSGLEFEDRGEHELKGVPDRWRLYRAVGITRGTASYPPATAGRIETVSPSPTSVSREPR
jgi:hypothetical protein